MTYLSLTIGPIYKTLSHAKKTRELWGGSYLFSYIMKQIVLRFKDRSFVVPYIGDETIFENEKGVGLFHDRFIFQAKEGDRKRLAETVDEVLAELSADTGMSLEFVKHYFQIHIVQRELDEGANPILEITPYLDSAELFYEVGQYSDNELSSMLKGNNSFLTKEAFGSKKSFPSLPQIAMHDLIMQHPEIKSRINDNDEMSIYEEKDIDLKPYHKYYAIVHADGDNMSKVIEQLKEEAFGEFSHKLFNFCIGADERIRAYGGETIFAGGDDLLFFSPVVSKDKTVFTLCDEISRDFDTYFKSNASLSFGVSIHYYKYPLYEALERSRHLLFSNAKKGGKNNIAFAITKHSGQTFGATIHKGDEEMYGHFKRFSSNIEGGEGMDNFLHSIHHKIDTHKVVLSAIMHDPDRLEAFFTNYFNKEVHDKHYRAFFEQLIAFMVASAQNHQGLEQVYATLRFIKFIQGDKA